MDLKTTLQKHYVDEDLQPNFIFRQSITKMKQEKEGKNSCRGLLVNKITLNVSF